MQKSQRKGWRVSFFMILGDNNLSHSLSLSLFLIWKNVHDISFISIFLFCWFSVLKNLELLPRRFPKDF